MLLFAQAICCTAESADEERRDILYMCMSVSMCVIMCIIIIFFALRPRAPCLVVVVDERCCLPAALPRLPCRAALPACLALPYLTCLALLLLPRYPCPCRLIIPFCLAFYLYPCYYALLLLCIMPPFAAPCMMCAVPAAAGGLKMSMGRRRRLLWTGIGL